MGLQGLAEAIPSREGTEEGLERASPFSPPPPDRKGRTERFTGFWNNSAGRTSDGHGCGLSRGSSDSRHREHPPPPTPTAGPAPQLQQRHPVYKLGSKATEMPPSRQAGTVDQQAQCGLRLGGSLLACSRLSKLPRTSVQFLGEEGFAKSYCDGIFWQLGGWGLIN